jgi:UDP-galactopyranose mutase
MKKVIIIGAGISGATLANKLANAGFIVNIYEQRNELGGNCYDFFNKNKVLVHKYGPHIFHTSYEDV